MTREKADKIMAKMASKAGDAQYMILIKVDEPKNGVLAFSPKYNQSVATDFMDTLITDYLNHFTTKEAVVATVAWIKKDLLDDYVDTRFFSDKYKAWQAELIKSMES